MSNANLIERLGNFDSEFDTDKILDASSPDALELADKRIARSRSNSDIMMETWRGIAEPERKAGCGADTR